MSAKDNTPKRETKTKSSKKKPTEPTKFIDKPASKSTFTLLPHSIKIDEYGMRGLNKHRNFFPYIDFKKDCDTENMKFKNSEELFEFCAEVLEDNGCDCSAIFLVFLNGNQKIVFQNVSWDEDEDCPSIDVSIVSPKALAYNDFFAEFDAGVRLHCYGMMVERDNGQWEICE